MTRGIRRPFRGEPPFRGRNRAATLCTRPGIRDDARVAPRDPKIELLLEVHRRFGPWIAARARRLFPRDWEDVVQDAMLKLVRALEAQRDHGDAALTALVGRTI